MQRAITLKRLLLAAIIGLVLWTALIAYFVISIRRYEAIDQAQPADVVIVLGSGLRRNGRPGDALYRRSVWGANLYNDGLVEAIICTGGVGNVKIRSEADACREVLEAQGVPSTAIILEDQSHSTEENALFSRQIMQDRGFNEAILVTDSFHMFRASWIFNDIGITHYRSPVPRDWVRRYYYVRHFSREVLALHWQTVKSLFGLPFTRI